MGLLKPFASFSPHLPQVVKLDAAHSECAENPKQDCLGDWPGWLIEVCTSVLGNTPPPPAQEFWESTQPSAHSHSTRHRDSRKNKSQPCPQRPRTRGPWSSGEEGGQINKQPQPTAMCRESGDAGAHDPELTETRGATWAKY